MTKNHRLERHDVIYLDYHATTPCDPRVASVIENVLTENFGNPSSPHAVGQSAKRIVDNARSQVARSINAFAGEIIFTSGATESNNIAIRGLASGVKSDCQKRTKIITSTVEHKSVLKSAEALKSQGYEVVKVPVQADGVVSLDHLEEEVDETTLVVSIQAANNELGTIQPIEQVSAIAHRRGASVHCDASQALGRMNIDVQQWGVDLLSLSSHKCYGPKGVGAMYIEGGPTAQPVESLTYGGGQEDGLRPGTVNVAGVAGFGEACRIICQKLNRERSKLEDLRNLLEHRILDSTDESQVLGDGAPRLPSTTNIRFPGVEAEAVLARVDGVAVSTGSACEAGAPEPSHVLQAIGLGREKAYECLRFAVGRFTSGEEIRTAASKISTTVNELRSVVA